MRHEVVSARLRWFPAIAVTAAAVAFALASCGGGDDDEPSTPATRPADGVWVIDQDNLEFEPGEITIASGDRVRFTNSETAIHNVNINDEDVSGTMERDDTFEWSPPGTGEYEVRCDFHPQMRATITVE